MTFFPPLFASNYGPDRSLTVHQKRRQHPINLFIWPESSGTPPADVRTAQGFQLRHWIRDGMSFWAVSDLNDAELAQFERALQQ